MFLDFKAGEEPGNENTDGRGRLLANSIRGLGTQMQWHTAHRGTSNMRSKQTKSSAPTVKLITGLSHRKTTALGFLGGEKWALSWIFRSLDTHKCSGLTSHSAREFRTHVQTQMWAHTQSDAYEINRTGAPFIPSSVLKQDSCRQKQSWHNIRV